MGVKCHIKSQPGQRKNNRTKNNVTAGSDRLKQSKQEHGNKKEFGRGSNNSTLAWSC